MRGYSGWSYAPYKPFLFETGDIYICRVAPNVNEVHFEWLDIGAEYSVYYRKRDEGEFILAGKTTGTEYTIKNLETETDFEFFVEANGKKSRIRIARTGFHEGVCVNYLHPDDRCYDFSGNYLCSPSLVRHPDGYLLSSMDVYGHLVVKGGSVQGTPQNLTLIFRSDDNGETWHYVSELMPSFWGKLFIHKGDVYMLSCSTDYGDLLIGKSTDGGKTFGTPSVLLRGSCNPERPGIHKNPQNVMYYNGRIYETFEWGTWRRECLHSPSVMSCDENDDLMVPENWSFAEPLPYNPEWPGLAVGNTKQTIEGTLCINPAGELCNVMRYNTMPDTIPPYGLVLCYKVNTKDPDAPMAYSHSIKFPCNKAKFMIKKDEITGKYYSIASRITDVKLIEARNLLSLMVSDDMENWEVLMDIFDYRENSSDKVGFQYVDFSFDGDDIMFACRTAMNGANNYHDSNYQTFHRIKDFRNL